MILIADSGSTKTDWVVVEKGEVVHAYTTPGINPYFLNKEDIVKIVKSVANSPSVVESKLDIYFYGAGCSAPEKSEEVRVALQEAFGGSEVYVEHDLLGACRALLNTEEGIVAILGTGSNSGFYDGKNIIQNVVSLGYVLGDEGSGAYLGKMLIKRYLSGDLTSDLKQEFAENYKLSDEEILDAVYRRSFPNRFLASFCPFLSKHISHPIVNAMVSEGFSDFFEAHILKYPTHNSLKIGFVGSVSYCFRNVLIDVAKKKNVQIGKILKSPIEGLTTYHCHT